MAIPALGPPYVETGDDVFNLETDWVEAIENRMPGSGASFTTRDGDAMLVIETTPNKCRDMVRKVLGFSFSEDTPKKLKRENPVCHPWFPLLRAVSISFSEFPPDASGGTLKAPSLDLAFAQPTPNYFAKYQRVYASVRFRSCRCYF